MKKYIQIAGVVMLAGMLATPMMAQEMVSTDTSRIHVVRPGDTLWDLAEFYYAEPFDWPFIHQANQGLVPNPHLILPAQRLVIPPPGEASDQPATPVERQAAVAAGLEPPTRTRFYPRPPDAQGMELTGESPLALSPVPEKEYLTSAWLTEGNALPVVAELVEVVGRRAGEANSLEQTAQLNDRVYLRYGEGPTPEVGDRLLMVRLEREVPSWGEVVVPLGIVRVTDLASEVATATITNQYDQVLPGDLAVRLSEAPDLTGQHAADVDDGPGGTLFAFVRDPALPGVHDQAFIDLGRADGLGIGDELTIELPVRSADGDAGVELPREQVGILRVLRLGENSATVKVESLTHPTLETGLPVRVVRRVQ